MAFPFSVTPTHFTVGQVFFCHKRSVTFWNNQLPLMECNAKYFKVALKQQLRSDNRANIRHLIAILFQKCFGSEVLDLKAATGKVNQIMTCFIYILDSSNHSSFTFWTSQFTSSSRCNWNGISTGNSNGSWTDKHSSHFSKAKEMSVKPAAFFM